MFWLYKRIYILYILSNLLLMGDYVFERRYTMKKEKNEQKIPQPLSFFEFLVTLLLLIIILVIIT